ncbi:MAG: 16S rRNA (uracil(1498)-N(3))-methyltransferase, partial [Alphaproteobacteria bacterium]|nr:16S rRNA (uracil(1498)-N(3))-methyltransferase [Alphaproteobacteria bacterium]
MAAVYISATMKTTPRLHLDASLAAGAEIALIREQTHYLVNVLRLSPGDPLRAFNGRDGEWLCYLIDGGKRQARLRCEKPTAAVRPPPDIDYVFAPIKHARLDYVVQKATELGARRLRPVITARTIAQRVNLDRMRANAIEAAEQCNLVFVPEVTEPETLAAIMARWPSGRALVHCDEAAPLADPLATLSRLALPAAVLVGPEGGFTVEEQAMLRSHPSAT